MTLTESTSIKELLTLSGQKLMEEPTRIGVGQPIRPLTVDILL